MGFTPLFQTTNRATVAVIRGERLRVRAELVELIAGANRTLAESRTLLVKADAILAREKFLFPEADHVVVRASQVL